MTMKVYEVVMHLDQGWLDQFSEWLNFAEDVEGEVVNVVSVQDITHVYEKGDN